MNKRNFKKNADELATGIEVVAEVYISETE